MTTLDLVDPEQREAVAAFLEFDPERHGLNDLRSLMVDGLGSLLTPEPVDFDVMTIPGLDEAPDIRALVHRPKKTNGVQPAILYIHGGGMVAGTPDMMAGAHRRLAQDTGAVVIAPAYRLGPEAPFPGGLEDCYAALVWLYAHAAELNIDRDRIAIMGDSGGGGLAAAVTLLARDRQQVPLRAQILLYPMLDIRTGTNQAPSDDTLTGEFLVNRALARFCWTLVRGTMSLDDEQIKYLSPALADNLEDLPPTMIVTGALDLFRDEDIAYAQRLLRSGVATDLFVHAGAVHGFDMLPGALTVQANANIVAGIKRLLGTRTEHN